LKAQRGRYTSLTNTPTIIPDFSNSNNYMIALTGSSTLGVPINIVPGQSGVINIHQDIVGSRTLSYAWCWQFVGGTAPVLSTTKLSFDQLVYMVNHATSSTVTLSVATPCVVTWNSHGLNSGDRIQLVGVLPTGLTSNTTYWVNATSSNALNLATTFANAGAGSFVITSGTTSGFYTASNISITLTGNIGVA
jgi:hypothetical protein